MRSKYAETCARGGLAWALIAASTAVCGQESSRLAGPDMPRVTPLAQQEAPRAEPIAQQEAQPPEPDIARIRQQLETQSRQLEAQRQALEEEEKKLQAHKRALKETMRQLDALMAKAGMAPAGPAAEKVAQAQPSPQPVGQAPEKPKDSRPPEVAPIFEQPSVLTARGKFVLEPSLQYAYSSNDRVSLVGYTIIPALVVGLIDVQHVNRQTFIGAITARYGLTNRLEVEAKVPYVYRNDDSVTRPLGTGASMDSAFNATGNGIGDIELAARYQLNEPGADGPYYVAGLRFKTRTGKDPFEVNYIPGSTPVSSLQESLPTGSGFYGIQPSLSVIYPSDPAVFFGGINYMWNIKRDVNTDILGQHIGTVDPGNAAGFNFGMGLALNEKAAFSLGYEHTWIGKSRIDGEAPPGSTNIQLASLLMGYSYRLNDKTTASLTLGAGLTRDTPDVQLTLRVPFSF